MAPHSVRISGRDPYKENSTINGSLDATWEFLIVYLDDLGWNFEPLLNKETSFFFGVGSWKDRGNFRKFIRVETLKYVSICLHGKSQSRRLWTPWRVKFYGPWGFFVERCTQLVVSVSGDYELVKIVEGKPSYKKAREGFRFCWCRQVIFAHIIHHKKPIRPFTLMFFALFIFSYCIIHSIHW